MKMMTLYYLHCRLDVMKQGISLTSRLIKFVPSRRFMFSKSRTKERVLNWLRLVNNAYGV